MLILKRDARCNSTWDAMHSVIEITKDDGQIEIIKCVNDGDIKYYCCKDVSRILALKKLASHIRDVSSHHKRHFVVNTPGGPQSMVFMSSDTVKSIISRTRSPEAVWLGKKLGMDVANFVPMCAERDTIGLIMRVFNGEYMVRQFQVMSYRVDLYFVDCRLAIECDEFRHVSYVSEDQQRQEHIQRVLGCTFIRYRPNEPIDDVLGRIYSHLRTWHSKRDRC